MKISCLVRLSEVPLHLYQVLSGIMMLENQGVLKLKVEKLASDSPHRLPYNMMEVIINGSTRVLYDVNDGYDNLLSEEQDYTEWFDSLLERFDICFKRSYSSEYNSNLKNKNKVYPLGLNYMVTIPRNIAHFPTSCDPSREQIKKYIRMLPFSQYYNGLYYVNTFEDIPRRELDPKILFTARLWDIDGQISPRKKTERQYINHVRAECVRKLRKEFGDNFFGGISPSRYAYENYSDVVIDNSNTTKRHNYLKKVKESDICVATMGLHESTGWKFAEYIAAGKAVVTEKLHYEATGSLAEEQNYLVFQTPEECVSQIYRLIQDNEFRYEMMVNNYRYYHEFLRADRLVLNSILNVLHTTRV